MSIKNKVQLIGNLGKDPEIINDGKIAKFSIATSETYTNKQGEKVTDVEWHNIIVFREPLIKVVQNHFKKGSSIALEGKITTNKWEDKDGNKRYTTQIIMNEFTFLGGKNDSSTPTPEATQNNNSQDNDLPF